MFSQDSSNVTIANVDAQGLLTDNAQVNVAPNSALIKCFPNSPLGAYGRPCGTFYSTWTSYPGGVALSKDGKHAYALLNQNDTLTKIDLTQNPPKQLDEIRVGNAPHSIVITSDGTTAYVSNEGGRAAKQNDFQIYSAGTEIVADSVVGSAVTGTVSAVDLATGQTQSHHLDRFASDRDGVLRTTTIGRQYLQRHHLGDRYEHQSGDSDDRSWAPHWSSRRRSSSIRRRSELDRSGRKERDRLRRPLQCQCHRV